MNKAIIVGNLGDDPKVNHTQNGTAVCNFSVATSERYKKDDEWHEQTEWHRVVVWGASAESCGKYLAKGSKVCVDGSIKTRKWEDKDGNSRYTTEINANRVEFLSKPVATGGGSEGGFDQSFNDDDIPF